MTITNQGSNIIGLTNPNNMTSGTRALKVNPLDKQISSLQEQIDKLNKNKAMDHDTKQLKIKELEDQIKEIEEQKRKEQLEEIKKSAEPPENNSPSNHSDSEDGGLTSVMTKALVSGSEAVKSIRQTNAIRVGIIADIRIAEGDVKGGDISSYSKEKGNSLHQALARTVDSLAKQFVAAQENIETSNEEMAAATQIANENKKEKEEENNASDNTSTYDEARVPSVTDETAPVVDGNRDMPVDKESQTKEKMASTTVNETKLIGTVTEQNNKVKLHRYKKIVPPLGATVDRTV